MMALHGNLCEMSLLMPAPDGCNGPIMGQRWALQPSVWWLEETYLRKGETPGGREWEKTKVRWAGGAPWQSWLRPWWDCSLWKTHGRKVTYFPEGSAACGGHTLEQWKWVRRKEQWKKRVRNMSIRKKLLHNDAEPLCITEETECNLQ